MVFSMLEKNRMLLARLRIKKCNPYEVSTFRIYQITEFTRINQDSQKLLQESIILHLNETTAFISIINLECELG